MDSTVTAAIIGAVGAVIAVVAGAFLARASRRNSASTTQKIPQTESHRTVIQIFPSSDLRVMQIQKETLPIVLAMAEPDRFSNEERGRLIHQGLKKGWSAIVADLRYLTAHIPKKDERYPVFLTLLDCAIKATRNTESKNQNESISMPTLKCEKCHRVISTDMGIKPTKCPYCGVSFVDRVICQKCYRSVTRSEFEEAGNKCPYCSKL